MANDNASLSLPIEFCEDLARGVVALPHGWGHQNSGNRVAKTSAGVNVNLLARSGAEHIDPISGMSQLTDLKVQIRKSTSADTTR